jgi:hypothetical protein
MQGKWDFRFPENQSPIANVRRGAKVTKCM